MRMRRTRARDNKYNNNDTTIKKQLRTLAKALWHDGTTAPCHDGNSNNTSSNSNSSSNTNRSNTNRSNSSNSSNSNSSINSKNSINSSNSNISSKKATATTAATARLRGGWRGAGWVVGQKGGPQCNNTHQSNNIVQQPLLDKNVPQCKDLNTLALALHSIQSP